MLQALKPHPDSHPRAALRIEAEAVRAGRHRLSLGFVLTGELEGLRVPAAATAVRTDGLWRHSCFEAFVRPPGGEVYYEINLSPSSEWAAYRFDRYRQGMTAMEIPAPSLSVTAGEGRLELQAIIELDLPPTGVRIGLAAVVEAADGSLSYWSLAHPPGKADFHHPDCFALELASTGRP